MRTKGAPDLPELSHTLRAHLLSHLALIVGPPILAVEMNKYGRVRDREIGFQNQHAILPAVFGDLVDQRLVKLRIDFISMQKFRKSARGNLRHPPPSVQERMAAQRP